MKLYLYQTADTNNKLIKQLTDEILLQGTLRTECSVLNPVIEIETAVNISNYNYARIEDFNRYYFITDITATSDLLWKITLRCDVLMSYASDIKKLEANILRNSNDFNLMLDDVQLNKYADDRVQCVNFPVSLTGINGSGQFKYYLTLIGGGKKQ